MDVGRIARVTAAGAGGAVLAWILSEPLAPTAQAGVRIDTSHFTLGTPFGFVSTFLLGASVAGPVAYIFARSRGEIGYALRTALAVALFAGLLMFGLDAFGDALQIGVLRNASFSKERKTDLTNFLAPTLASLTIGGLVFAVLSGSPTRTRLLRALTAGLVVGLFANPFARIAHSNARIVHTISFMKRDGYVANVPWDAWRLLTGLAIGSVASAGAGLAFFGVRGYWMRREFANGDVWVTPLEKGRNRIGRRSGLEVNLWDDDGVQPLHAVLDCAPTPWRIYATPKAPLFVNGQAVQDSVEVKQGDAIQVGTAILRATDRYAPSFEFAPAPVVSTAVVAALTNPALVDDSGETLPLPDGRYTVGRDVAATLSFPFDRSVSRRHAELDVRNGVAAVWDLGSSNGTTVNGVAIQTRTVLKAGDRVAFGNVALTFRPSA